MAPPSAARVRYLAAVIAVALPSAAVSAQPATPGAAAAGVATEGPDAVAAVPPVPPSPPVPAVIHLERDTVVRLMVLNEVTTKTARPGDRFVLIVDQDVLAGGSRIIPTGSKAWGEVVSATESGAVGKAGTLRARLLYIDTPAGRVPIRGEQGSQGPGGAGATALAVVGLGVLGLMTRGTNAKLKAGEIFNGYTLDRLAYDPATARLSAAEPAMVAPLATIRQ